MIPPLAPIALSFLAGTLLVWFLPVVPAGVLGMGLVYGAGSLVWGKRPRLGFVALALLWLCVGVLRTTAWQYQPVHHVARLVAEEPAPVLIHGVVVEDPVEFFSPNEPERLVCVLDARHVRTQDDWRVTTGLIRARLYNPRFALAYGDEVLLEGTWSQVPGPSNPGQYDWRAALARQRIHALLSVGSDHGMLRLRAHQGHGGFHAIYTLRHRLERFLDARFSPYHAGLLRSFLLGQRVSLDEDLKQAFVETGTMHLVVISGFNVGLIAGILELLLRLLGLPLRPRLLASAVILLGYCLLTGMQPPVVRATVMAWVVLGAVGLDRVINWPNTLAAAALAIVWVNPSQVWDPGFQLSFGAVISLLLFTTRLRRLLEPGLPIAAGWLKRYVAIGLSSTVAIWIGLWPLLAWYFHLVSPVSVIANLVLVPLVSVLVSVGTMVLMVGAVAEPVIGWASGLLTWLVDVTVACVEGCHRLPLGWWPVGRPSWFLMLGYAAFVLLSLMRHRIRLPTGWLLAGWLLGLNIWLWGELGARHQASRWLEVTFLDVGHGDSIVVRTPGRQTLLVDAGTAQAGQYVVAPFLRARRWHTLEALILTHPDEDHLGGSLAVLRHLRVKALLTNGFPASTPTAQQVFALADRRGIPHRRLAAGTRLAGLAGMQIDILHPPVQGVPGTAAGSNDNSLVMRLTKGQASVLLCGDLEERGVPWLLASSQPLSSTILKVPHHGSALGSAGGAFFRTVRPRASIISVGRLHHLPDPGVLTMLEAIQSRVFLTRRDGAITVKTDGRHLRLYTSRAAKRWWDD